MHASSAGVGFDEGKAVQPSLMFSVSRLGKFCYLVKPVLNSLDNTKSGLSCFSPPASRNPAYTNKQ